MKELMLEQGKLSKHDLYEFLREELMVSLINMTSVAGLSDSREAFITPSRYWQLFLQFNQRAKIEAFPIMVEDYLAQVTKEPTDAELKETYDKGSLYYPSKLSPIAGFRKRYQANIEFVAGNMETFLAPEKAKVTEEQIKEAYDKQVAEGRFKVPAAPAAPNSPLSTDPAGTPVANPDAGTPPAPPRPPQIENHRNRNPRMISSLEWFGSSIGIVRSRYGRQAARDNRCRNSSSGRLLQQQNHRKLLLSGSQAASACGIGRSQSTTRSDTTQPGN